MHVYVYVYVYVHVYVYVYMCDVTCLVRVLCVFLYRNHDLFDVNRSRPHRAHKGATPPSAPRSCPARGAHSLLTSFCIRVVYTCMRVRYNILPLTYIQSRAAL